MKPIAIIYNLGVVLLVALAVLLVVARLPIPGNYKVFTVLSGSMDPAMKMGAVAVVKPMNDYNVGDIITFGEISKTKTPTTHRIYDIKLIDGAPFYITKGDANAAPDGREIAKSEVQGKVLFSIPYLGYALNFVRQPLGFLLIIVLPASLIVLSELVKIWRQARLDGGVKKNNDAEEKQKQNDSES